MYKQAAKGQHMSVLMSINSEDICIKNINGYSSGALHIKSAFVYF